MIFTYFTTKFHNFHHTSEHHYRDHGHSRFLWGCRYLYVSSLPTAAIFKGWDFPEKGCCPPAARLFDPLTSFMRITMIMNERSERFQTSKFVLPWDTAKRADDSNSKIDLPIIYLLCIQKKNRNFPLDSYYRVTA